MSLKVEKELKERYELPRSCRCGYQPIVEQNGSERLVRCPYCGLSGGIAYTQAAAIMQWNKRGIV